MKISSTYTIALELLLICEKYKDSEKITSGSVSKKIGADSAIVRRVMSDLKNSSLIESKPGPGGTILVKPLSKITLYDVFISVTEKEDSILKFYDLPTNSTFETNIIQVSNALFDNYIDSFYQQLKAHTLDEIYNAANI